VAALRPEKGLDILVRAFALVARVHAGLRLVIVGGGPMRQPLENLAHSLGIAAQALFVPATADVVPWLRAMDIFVLPSLSEAFSNSLMEAMACGCCAVASNVGGNPELVQEARTGLLFRSRDVEHLQQRLDLLIRNSGLRRQMAEAGSIAVRTGFPLAAAAARMGEIYSTLLDHAEPIVSGNPT